MSRDRALDALKRINDASQQTLGRAADVAVRRSELGPATGFDTAGAPPIAELARLEDDSRRRLSPKRRLWGELGTFDERVAELDARHAAAQADLTAVRELLRGAPDKDTADLSRRIDNGEKGGRPIPTEPQCANSSPTPNWRLRRFSARSAPNCNAEARSLRSTATGSRVKPADLPSAQARSTPRRSTNLLQRAPSSSTSESTGGARFAPSGRQRLLFHR
jgi:hypothetical protein